MLIQRFFFANKEKIFQPFTIELTRAESVIDGWSGSYKHDITFKYDFTHIFSKECLKNKMSSAKFKLWVAMQHVKNHDHHENKKFKS